MRKATSTQPANKGRKYPAEPLTADEAVALIKACSNRAPTGVRNRALITLLWRGMLRASETLSLYPKDIDLDAGTVRVLSGKGRKDRLIGLDPMAMSIIQRWLDVRAKLGFKGRQRLFCTLRGDPLKTAYIRAMLPRMARRAGIEKRVHAHGLRHTGAAELAREGKPIVLISRQLGHSSAATTDRYINHLCPQDVVAAMKAREWSLECLRDGDLPVSVAQFHAGGAVVVAD